MSNISGDGGSFYSGNNTGEDEGHHHHPSLHPSSAIGPEANPPPPPPPPPPAAKKKRSLPGTPDPNAEVIALSPRALMATNRFVCEICHKGFQRDQNLQLHRRGHNLPWKLRQRPSGSGDAAEVVRKKVYVCPEPTCAHHEPSRALGDLTGIKKHFCRKHGEKKWKCDKCSKKYAVQSDWKAHSKVCGTREYKCDCGTVFSRRDSFITHRAFCDALAQESNKLNQPMMASNLQGPAHILLSDVNGPVTTSAGLSDFTDDVKGLKLKPFSDETLPASLRPLGMAGCMLSSFGPSSLHLKGTTGRLGLDGLGDAHMGQVAAGSSGVMSATALLQKAAQMGAAPVSNNISSAMMHRGVVSMMAGPDRFSGMRPCGLIRANGLYNQIRLQEEHDHLAELGMNQHYGAPTNDLSAFSRPIPYLLGGGSGGGRGGDVRMVDYLGVGPQRSPHERHNPQQHAGFQGLIPHQRLQSLGPLQEMTHGLISLEKPIWDV